MKRIRTSLALAIPLAILLFSGCSALTRFYVTYTQEFVLQPGLGTGTPLSFSTPAFPTNSVQVFQVNNTSAELLEGCKLVEITGTITNPAGEDFSFLNSVHVYISAVGLPEVEIAYRDNIPDTVGNTLSLQPTEVELVEYIKQETIIIRMQTINDEVTLNQVTVSLFTRFFIDAEILGQ